MDVECLVLSRNAVILSAYSVDAYGIITIILHSMLVRLSVHTTTFSFFPFALHTSCLSHVTFPVLILFVYPICHPYSKSSLMVNISMLYHIKKKKKKKKKKVKEDGWEKEDK